MVLLLLVLLLRGGRICPLESHERGESLVEYIHITSGVAMWESRR